MNTLPFLNPVTGQQFGEVPAKSPADVQQAVADLRRNAPSWQATSVRDRVRILRKLQKAMVAYSEEITTLISQDTGKSRQDAMIELFMVVDKLKTYLKHAPKWLAKRRVPPGLYLFKRYYTEPQPFGVVAVIGPWNYPFDLGMPPLYAALIAGNCVLYKPSEVTPAVGVLIEKLIHSVPELTPYVRIMHGGPATGAALVASEPDLVFLTGSTSTGRKVAQATADRMIPYICELGGKDPMIVLEDADLKAAARWGTWGATYHAGQSCVAVERLYVVESVYDEFMRLLLAEMKKVKVGSSTDRNSPYHYGPLTFDRQLTIIQDHIQDAVAKGAEIIYGGQHDHLFMEPTVLINVDHSMKIMQDETFGPVLPVMKVRDEAEAIRLANDSDLGLGACVWSEDIARAERVGQQLEVGTVNINDVISHYAVTQLPFGGVKQSGTARTHGKEEVMQFTQLRSFSVGGTPKVFDLATQLRKPGRYWLGDLLLKTTLGVTPKQKLEPLTDAVHNIELKPALKRTATGIALVSAAIAFAFHIFRGRD